MKSIAVFCGSSEGNDKQIIEESYQLGKTLASQNITLVYGAAKIGIMGKVAQGVIDANGKVIGIIPVFLKTKEIVHTELHELIITENMHSRKVIMYDKSDGFIIISKIFTLMCVGVWYNVSVDLIRLHTCAKGLKIFIHGII